ncbi:MAG: ImmA/IrrE family metallo-endopeptidase [Syntrophothermus sp.]|uniref:ImmA/IrrE family metallo-endopeptidase n=1 Tax=Syntrophothermus sp. TaxID=2736299 RepID=UPI00257ACAAD|nr:ImmA/IrrE family metallo-endopeptidase [Syntrophothermus sp.]NSW83105.1 ImmA/IrrE family metallo-endopeptidase [Syntrophothermus sp.]
MIRLSQAEIYARELLQLLNIDSVPVDPFQICKHFNIEVCYEPLRQCEAVLLIQSGAKKIILSDSTPYHLRQKFSLAHELGHYYMPHHELLIIGCSASDLMTFESNPSTMQEWEANVFASELLMPHHHIAKDAKAYEYSAESVKEIADKYEVSITAAAVRLLQVTPDSAAIVLSANGQIKWFKKSQNFRYYIRATKTMDPAAHIYDFYSKGAASELLKQTRASIWLENPKNLDYVNEQSIIMPSLNAALTILTIPFDEDNNAL